MVGDFHHEKTHMGRDGMDLWADLDFRGKNGLLFAPSFSRVIFFSVSKRHLRFIFQGFGKEDSLEKVHLTNVCLYVRRKKDFKKFTFVHFIFIFTVFIVDVQTLSLTVYHRQGPRTDMTGYKVS
jgi:hypothetical protein